MVMDIGVQPCLVRMGSDNFLHTKCTISGWNHSIYLMQRRTEETSIGIELFQMQQIKF